MMLRNRNAFTLAEVMVTLAVVGILAAIMTPIIAQSRPNKHKALFKKAYAIAERMVYELVNDEDLYPTNGTSVGLDNVNKIEYLGIEYGDASDETERKSKFCRLFARKVNTESDTPNCDANHATFSENGPAFKTTDGIAWYMPYTDFEDSLQTIEVDINGDTSPNCTYGEDCKDPDRFQIKVYADGKMFVDGVKEKEYLTSNDSLR